MREVSRFVAFLPVFLALRGPATRCYADVMDPARRCNAHGLATADDGLCVVCRRGTAPPTAASRIVWVAPVVGLALLVGTVFVASLWKLAHRATAEPPTAAAVAGAHIVVWGTTSCPACRSARRWLDARGYAYEFRDVSSEATLRELVVAAKLPPGRVSIPVIEIGGVFRQGFDPGSLASRIEEASAARPK